MLEEAILIDITAEDMILTAIQGIITDQQDIQPLTINIMNLQDTTQLRQTRELQLMITEEEL